MFYHDGKLQYNVEVEKPNPHFAKMLQQAIGGIEGEMRVALQYLFQSWGFRGPKRYKDLLLETGTEELAHIEMLATAVSLNLEGSSDAFKEEVTRKDPMMAALHGGMPTAMEPCTRMAAGQAGAPSMGRASSPRGRRSPMATKRRSSSRLRSPKRTRNCRAWWEEPGQADG